MVSFHPAMKSFTERLYSMSLSESPSERSEEGRIRKSEAFSIIDSNSVSDNNHTISVDIDDCIEPTSDLRVSASSRTVERVAQEAGCGNGSLGIVSVEGTRASLFYSLTAFYAAGRRR